MMRNDAATGREGLSGRLDVLGPLRHRIDYEVSLPDDGVSVHLPEQPEFLNWTKH
jgi:hypothetical protein